MSRSAERSVSARPPPDGLVLRGSGREGRRPVDAHLLREGAWVAAGQFGCAVAVLASVRVLTELLSPAEFGRLSLLVGMAALALGLAAGPRLQAMLRYYPDAARAGRIDGLRAVTLHQIAPLVALAVAVLASGWLIASPWTGGAWFSGLLIAALIVVDCLRSLELSLFNAARRQRAAAAITVVDAASRLSMAVAAVFVFGPGAEAALAGYVAGSALIVLTIRLGMRLEGAPVARRRRPGENEVQALAMRRYAWPLAPLALCGWLSGMGDRYLIAGALGLQEAGFYAAACALASRPFLMLGGTVELTMRPVLQDAVAAGNAALIARAKTVWLLVTAAGAASGAVCFALLSEWAGGFLLAAQYRHAAGLMPWIAAGYALGCVATVYTRFCYAQDDTRAVLLLTAAGAFGGLAILIPAVAVYGLAGAALAVPARFAVELVLARMLSRRGPLRCVAA